MPFFGIEDGFAFHPKVLAAGNAAIGAWARMGSHCIEHGTNGFVSEKLAKTIATPAQLRKLLECRILPGGVGLLEPCEQNGVKGYIFHDWTQPDIETMRKRREVRARAGRKGGIASGASRRAAAQADSKHSYEANASPNASARAQASAEAHAEANGQAKRSTEDEDEYVTTHLSSAPYVSDAPTRNGNGNAIFDAATSERGLDLSPPVSVGASRLVATVVRNGAFNDADRTILRIKTSQGLNEGRTEDDMAECLRIWLTKPELGPHALLCCLTEIDKRKLNGHRRRPSTSDGIVADIDAMRDNPRQLGNQRLEALFPAVDRKEITSGP